MIAPNAGRVDLAALYLRHRDAMYRVAASVLRGTGREHEVEDAVSDAITSLIASPPKDVENWEAFLVAVTKRKAIDRLRSAHVRHAGGPLMPQDERPDGADIAEQVADEVDRARAAARAWECLAVLDARDRTVVISIAVEGRPGKDVAKDLGVTPGRVSQILTKSLQQLKDEMGRREASA